MEHSLHIVAKHFIEKINLGSHCNNFGNLGEDAGTNNDDRSDSEDFDSGDSLGKAIALVKQVSLSLPSLEDLLLG